MWGRTRQLARGLEEPGPDDLNESHRNLPTPARQVRAAKLANLFMENFDKYPNPFDATLRRAGADPVG